MCGGFTCSKNALTALNILYILVAFILIGVAVYGRTSPLGADLPTIGGILACGVFLILISILGLIGAIKHHQVLLFFYMIILFLLFCVQFSIACACLAVNSEQQEELAKEGWKKISPETKVQIQTLFECCEFEKNNTSIIETSTSIPDTCLKTCCHGKEPCTCSPCMDKLKDTINYAFKLCGGIGLFFSFTEVGGSGCKACCEVGSFGGNALNLTMTVHAWPLYELTLSQSNFASFFQFLGVWLTVRYRNQKDPRANPSAFL